MTSRDHWKGDDPTAAFGFRRRDRGAEIDAAPIDVDALQRLWEATTKGEWKQNVLAIKCGYETVVHFDISNDFRPPRPHECENNATFVAAAHFYWPALIAKCREQEAEIAMWKTRHDECVAKYTMARDELAAANEREQLLRGSLTIMNVFIRTIIDEIGVDVDDTRININAESATSSRNLAHITLAELLERTDAALATKEP